MLRQIPSGPTFTQTPPGDVLLGAGFGPDEDGAAASCGGAVAAGGRLAALGADVGGGSAPPLRVVPPVPVPALLPPPVPWPPPAAVRLGGLASDPSRSPEPRWVSCLLSDPGPGWPGPPNPAARPRDAPEMGIAPAVTTGGVPEADDWVAVRGVGRTRIETVEKSRKAIAPPESTMTGTVLPAGCRRKTAPARPMAVLIRSASSANTSCTAGSRGQ